MSTLAERKCALLLVSLRRRDRYRLLGSLPAASARTIRRLVAELEDLPWPMAELANELLGDEVRGLTEHTSIALDQLVALSTRLPPAWFARVLSAWSGVDQTFCLALLEGAASVEVRGELDRMAPLPPKLADALKAEAIVLSARREAA